MRLTVLVDNNTLIDQYLLAEPGLSYWIESDARNILFDVGYSDVFIKNAEKLGMDLATADYLVLSHGHLDHTWGLEPYIDLIGDRSGNVNLVAHPSVFERKSAEGVGNIGTRKSKTEISRHFNLSLSREPVWLTPNLCFLGQIPRKNNFEARVPLGVTVKDGKESPDYLIDDTALAYKSNAGLVVITGCSHSGICNIVEHAKAVTGQSTILDIIGGFHLRNARKEVLDNTIAYLKSCNTLNCHACHCTDLDARAELGKHLPVQEVGCGLTLDYV